MSAEMQSLMGGGSQQSTPWPKIFGGAGLVTAGLAAGAGLMYGLDHFTTVMGAPKMAPPPGGDPFSEDRQCGTPESFDWQDVSTIDDGVRIALKKSLKLLDLERKSCELGAMPALPFTAAQFEDGQKDDGTYVHAHHKFTPSCEEETYKLHMFIPAEKPEDKETSVIVHLFHTIQDDRWEVLKSEPSACDIRVGTPAAPDVRSTDGQDAKEFAKFAVTELQFQQKMKGCLAKDGKLELLGIKGATSRVENGILMDMLLNLKSSPPTGDATEATVKVTVESVCGRTETGTCVKELMIPDPEEDVCSIMTNSEKSARLLMSANRLGDVQPDPTDVKLARRKDLFTLRHLRTGDRPGMRDRYIQSGDVPKTWDPRDEDCHKKVHMYNQGSCGSCYAQSVAAMMGIRKCNVDKGLNGGAKRMLLEKANNTVLKVAKESAVRELSDTCEDNSLWTDISGDGCDWYGKNDPACKKYKDYGQKSHCPKTCDSCPVAPGDTSRDPWNSAWYQYMPNAGEIAKCDLKTGDPNGCDGGSAWSTWEKYLRLTTKELVVMGAKCQPYDLKCWSSSGVVNPETGGSCTGYGGYELWHKPCSCIGTSERPTEYICPTAAPSSQCGFPAPVAMFSLKTSGLSSANRVLNIQRHIHEYGPVYISFAVTSDFMNWDWNSKPIYTGGSGAEGGHAVMAVGWGNQGSTDYWILRNSWDAYWADGGYCKFKRGVNLDDIESRGIAAAMPVEGFEDSSSPYCDVKKGSRSWSWSGAKLVRYEWIGTFRCDKAGSVGFWMSKHGNHGSLPHFKTVDVKKDEDFELRYPLQCHGYGLSDDDLDVIYEITDGNGNKAEFNHDVNIPAIAGMTSLDDYYC
mmetsp:Transcript_75439/g.157298  ORF Transcript_75439/g.157298 Transcript_75439/m.157298 type:complete len:855 (+) Transcript_75439:141-2705(+)|eukprot:CAMPEP_0206453356 /NCGR_PEP_ID=MMETSP0324_2-20121206/20494_1 /ASSEMBLY_ACC=CAM_ASM_000836 /TAXON_ID=2866 /ORGANISM="Crypthecodinium cohnii, Strain Seligo" /LENGTH=854 /DNA_ID=CAMNT_0053923625 /DNA_START=92 /DNA_END=2656 /DNA_ORIENTATION=-